jgi:acetyltransferase-like isoleucine patch superfamily enzyme/acyl carrier protein
MSVDRDTLISIICDVFGLQESEVGPDLSMDSCEAWDSLGHLNLVLALEDAFGVRFGTEEVPEMRDLVAVEKALARASSNGTSSGLDEAPELRPIESRGDPEPSQAVRQTDQGLAAGSSEDDLIGSKEFAALSSEEKIDLYRAHGSRIGDDVTFEPGSQLVAREIVVGNHARIGAGSVLRAGRIELGEGCCIGRDNDWLAHEIRVGDGSIIGDRVSVDVSGGGLTSRAVLRIGRLCSITADVVLNVARAITLEDEVALSPRVTVFTHSYWQSVLEGYAARFDEVYFEQKSWVGTAVTVLPGCTIGEGSIVMPNSCVATSLPPRTLAGGVPARPIQTGLGRSLMLEERERRAHEIVEEFIAYLKERGCSVMTDSSNARGWVVRLPDGSRERMVYGAADPDATSVGFGLAETGGPTLDLERLEARGPDSLLKEELRNFLRRYGIRMTPIHWRYKPKRGLGRFE